MGLGYGIRDPAKSYPGSGTRGKKNTGSGTLVINLACCQATGEMLCSEQTVPGVRYPAHGLTTVRTLLPVCL
jgi:hypothetical protein